MKTLFKGLIGVMWLMATFTACSKLLPRFNLYNGTMNLNGESLNFTYAPRLTGSAIEKPFNSRIFEEDDYLYFYLSIMPYNTGVESVKGSFALIMMLPDGVEVGKRYDINSCAMCQVDWDVSQGERVGVYMQYFPFCYEYADTTAIWQDSSFKSDVDGYNHTYDKKYAARQMRMICEDELVDGYVSFQKFDEIMVNDTYPGYDITFSYNFKGECVARWNDSIRVPVTMTGKINATCVSYKNPVSNNMDNKILFVGDFVPSHILD